MVCIPIAAPRRTDGNTSVIIDMLVVMTAADPTPIRTLHPMRNQKSGENAARSDARAVRATPARNIALLPYMSPILVIGTMKMTDDSRKDVLTYARAWDPTPNS